MTEIREEQRYNFLTSNLVCKVIHLVDHPFCPIHAVFYSFYDLVLEDCTVGKNAQFGGLDDPFCCEFIEMTVEPTYSNFELVEPNSEAEKRFRFSWEKFPKDRIWVRSLASFLENSEFIE